MERQKFDDSWKKAFDQAEVSPSDNLWTNIELDLEKAEGSKIKRRLLFYQMVAAASVIFAMAAGSLGLYFFNEKNSGQENHTAVNNAGNYTPETSPVIDNSTRNESTNNSSDKNIASEDQKVSENLIAKDVTKHVHNLFLRYIRWLY